MMMKMMMLLMISLLIFDDDVDDSQEGHVWRIDRQEKAQPGAGPVLSSVRGAA